MPVASRGSTVQSSFDRVAYGASGFALALMGTLVIAAVSFRYYEQPFLRIKSGFGG